MKLKNIYEKDIERSIQGVIKIDDESFIKQELEEYVLTNEILKHFHLFFDAYNHSLNTNTQEMGVWISGFFGSGKSHFLKMISYLLENKIVDGKKAIDYFEDKIQDKMLLADIKRAGSVSSDVILFNIDSKAILNKITGKKELLSVFEQVFNEKINLSGLPYVAEFEEFLINENKYEEFKKCFKEESNQDWIDIRHQFRIRRDEITKAYSKALKKSIEEAENWYDNAPESYEVSIEKFAKRIKSYIESKNENHQVIFLVDEVGQYIGDDKSLLLNLQTIVEDLGLYCGGKAWVIVTSQEAIDDVIKVHGLELSKIQGRFDVKLSLSSTEADEVIKKRILEKTKTAKETLKLIYDKEESIIRNLLTFKNASYQKIYKDKNEFVDVYPFVPYQFNLLQSVFTEIRTHGYAGKHLSSGERPLLAAFQEAAKLYKEKEVISLVPFYTFYDAIEKFLEHQIISVIKRAENIILRGELKEIDVNILKMLFLLKNIKEIPTNIDNLATLYVSNINDDKVDIKKDITDSLRRLEKQTLIQRSNDVYIFLTNVEQEVNREIKKVFIDQSKITEYLGKIIYGPIFPEDRYQYKNKLFRLSKYIDNSKFTQDYEVGIKVLTLSFARDNSEIIEKSIRENNFVFIKLELSSLTYDEIKYILQVEDYRRSKGGVPQTEQIEDILHAKERENQSTKARIQEVIAQQLKESEIFISGVKQNITAKDFREKIFNSLDILINNIYTKFNFIKQNYGINDIKTIFLQNQQNLHEKELEFLNQKAYEAMQDYVVEKSTYNIPITIRELLQEFSKAPYGYNDDDILYLLTRLLKNEEISLVYLNEVQNVTSEETLNKILKRNYYDQTIIKIREKVNPELINNLKSVARTAFDIINLRDDEDGMVKDFKEKGLNIQINKLKEIKIHYSYMEDYPYPGEEVVLETLTLLERLNNIRDLTDFYQEIRNEATKLEQQMSKINEIISFFSSSQKEIFDTVKKALHIYNDNKDFVDKSDELKETIEELNNIMEDNSPYNKINQLPALKDKLNNILINMYEEKSIPIIDMVKATIEYIETETKRENVSDDFKETYIQTCKNAIKTLETSNELKNIFAQETRINQLKDNFINALEKEINKDNLKEPKDIIKRKPIKTEMLMNRSYEINSKEDVEKYINELKEKLLKELEENNNLIIR